MFCWKVVKGGGAWCAKRRYHFDVVVCGAGVSGLSTAYHLAELHKGLRIGVVDSRGICGFTSIMSTEAYRNFWSNGEMTSFMNRSLDILFQFARKSENRFNLNQRGYAFVSSRPEGIEKHRNEANTAHQFGVGEVRTWTPKQQLNHINPITQDQSGIDLIQGPSIQELFPFLTEQASSVLYARRCGWMDAQQYAVLLAEEGRKRGVSFVSAQISSLGALPSGSFEGKLLFKDGTSKVISFGTFVNAAGPFAPSVHGLLELPPLPVHNEVHAKVVMQDPLQVVPPTSPFMIWDDPVQFEWSQEEREELEKMGGLYSQLVGVLPSGVHFRPSPGGYLVMLWDFVHSKQEVSDPPADHIHFEELYPEIVLRGLSKMIPRMKEYLNQIPKYTVDGGYYTKSLDNKPLIGPAYLKNYFLCTALAGYGIMASPAAGELAAKHILNTSLPSYSHHFMPDRFERPDFELRVESKSL